MENSTSPTSPPSIIRPDANRRLRTNELHSPDLEDSASPTGGGGESSPIKNPRASQRRTRRTRRYPEYTIKESDDGFQWRKYGQKMILNSEFPRNYYRCAHKLDEGCQAEKQILKVSHEPPLYRTAYRCEHTCSLARAVGRPSELIVSTLKSEQMKEQSTLSTLTTSDNSNIYGDAPFPVEASSSSCVTFDHQEEIVMEKVYSKFDPSSDTEFDYMPIPCSDDESRYKMVDPSTDKGSQDLRKKMDENELSSDVIMEETKDGLPKYRTEEGTSCCSILFLLPDDYEFQEDTLIQLWMAAGYIKDEFIGHEYFHSLFNDEYLLHCGTDFVTGKERYQINIKKVKELLNNNTFHLQWGNESPKYSNSTEVQHLSLVCNDIDASIFQTLEQFNELRTLLFLRSYGNKVSQIPDHLFQSFKELRALDLSRTSIKKLPSSVGCMIRLRYLDLSGTSIEWLPDIICSLEELQTLKLRRCSKLRGLPRQLKKLTKLRHLDVDVLRQLATIPAGIGALVNLRTLSAFLVSIDDGCKIQELKELNNLTGEFCIAMLENVGNADEAKEAALNKKQHIIKLELRWTASQLSRTENSCYDVLEYLQPCSSLKELQIFCYKGSTFPNWIGDPTFDQLVSVTFFNCEHVSELPLIEQLPFLKHLELVKMNGVKKIERRGKPEQAAFFSLEKLEVDEMQSLRSWKWTTTNEGDFTSLVELTINGCPQLDEFHVLPSLSSVKHLEIKECPKLESLSETKLPDSLEELIVEDCPIIKRKCSQQGGEDWYKIQHVSNIRICVDDDEDDL